MLIEPIRVEVEPEEGDDLLEALSVRGLESRLLRGEERIEVEVSPPPENWELWNIEVVSALEAWLEQADRGSVVARTQTRSYTVRAPRPLADRAPAPPPPSAAEAPADDEQAAPDVVTARMPVLPALQPPVGPVGLAEPAAYRARSRPILIAAALATVLLAAVGLGLLAIVLAQLL
jgi:hypothetical protein